MTKRLAKIGLLIVTTTLLIWYLRSEFQAGPPIAAPPRADVCATANLPASISPLNEQLVAFDDTSIIAFNLPRELVVDTTLQMQEIRRELAFMDVADCIQPLKVTYIAYMDSVIDVLVSFISGASPSQTQAGLANMQPFRASLEAEYASLLSVTLTPYPTSYTQGLIPVTGSQTQAASAILDTPTVVLVLAEVQGADGANLRFGPDIGFSFEHVVPPLTVVQVIGQSEDGQWVFVAVPGLEEGQGWIYLPLLSIGGDLSQIPIITTP